ncbi:MAG: tyrosine--tRNA ligase, partial [Muribaculaceae bacterium]|nr:tyrosine--tRNA ligase [Muribaculaceae bacterium]
THEEIEDLVAQQAADPGQRPLQKRLAREITTMVHSEEDCNAAIEASQILFNPKATQQLRELPEELFLDIMDGVPQFEVSREVIDNGTRLADLLTAPIAAVFPSKGEYRKMVQGGGLSINKEKITDVDAVASADMLLNGKYILVQRGKKNMFLIKVA